MAYLRAMSTALMVYTMVVAFAFAPATHLVPRNTIIMGVNQRRVARVRSGDSLNPGKIDPDDWTRPRPMHVIMSDDRSRFTFNGESGIGGGMSAMAEKWCARDMANTLARQKMARKYMQQQTEQQMASDAKSSESDGIMSAESRTERIARGREMLQSAIDERYLALLTPHLEAFTKDAVNETELAWHKAEARKEAESAYATEREMLDEQEALLNMVVEADALVSSLSQQLVEATMARDQATGKLEAALMNPDERARKEEEEEEEAIARQIRDVEEQREKEALEDAAVKQFQAASAKLGKARRLVAEDYNNPGNPHVKKKTRVNKKLANNETG